MAEKAEIVLVGTDKTAGAFASAKRGFEGLQASAVGIAARLGAIGATAVVAAEALDRFNPKSVIDTADGLNKLSQRAGIAVDTLSAYQYAGKLADVTNEELATSFKKLNQNIAAAARGEKEQADAFKAIGVSVVDSSGKVRAADKVFEDIAERFSGYNDGAKKVALANAVGGKSFEKLIPLLNGGKQGLSAARVELEKFGGVITEDLARKAEQFNDNLTKLSVAGEAVKVTIAGGLIDSLVSYSNEAVEAAKTTGLLSFALDKYFDLFITGKATREFVFGKGLPPDKLKAAREDVDSLTTSIAKLQDYLSRNPGSNGSLATIEKLQGKLKAAQGVIAADEARGARIGGGRGVVTLPFTPGATELKDAPALPNSQGTADAEALLRKQLDGRVKAIQDALERETDLFKFSDAQLAEQYQHGELSIADFYDRKNQIQLDGLAAQSKAATEEVALFRQFQAKFSKPADRADLENKATEAIQRQGKAFREAGQAATVAEQQRVHASEDFQRSLRDLDAQLAELGGDKFGAELLRNAQRLDDAKKLLSKGGGDDARAANIERALAAQAKFNQAQLDYSQITERAQISEESFIIKAERSGASRAEVEKGIAALREKSLSALDQLIASTERLTATSTDPQQLLFYEQLKLAREKAFDAKDPGLLRFNELAAQAGETVANSFVDAAFEGKKLRDVINDLDKSLARIITQDLVTKPLSGAITGFIKDLGSSGSGGGADKLVSGIAAKFSAGFGNFISGLFGSSSGFGTGAGFGNQDLGLFLHGGGIVGGTAGTYRPVPAGVWNGAPRYHGGGIAGLQPDERPAILRKGEEVLRVDDPRNQMNGGKRGDLSVYAPVFNIPPNTDQRSIAQVEQAAFAGAQRSWRRNS